MAGNSVSGKSKALIGMQYGDEGKARVLDKIIGDSNIVARFNGGSNAGHTLEVDNKKIALHQVPSGIFHPNMILYIGSGCVVNPEKLVNEIVEINNLGINLEGRLFISGNASLIQPHHILMDSIFGKDIGTTNNGIGPAYADQALRAEGRHIKNIKMGEYVKNPNKSFDSVKRNLISVLDANKFSTIDSEPLIASFDNAMKLIGQYLCSDPLFLEKHVLDGKNVFFEGAQSVMLDCVTGLTPYVTSSRTIAQAAYTGGDLSLRHHEKVIGVAKAIMSRVGNGPFISEFGGMKSELYCAENGGNAHRAEYERENYDPISLLRSEDMFDVGIAMRMLGGEYGATTKRPRRTGMLDLVMLKQNCLLNGVDELYINKFDLLPLFGKTKLEGIPLVTAYNLDGKTIDYMPTTESECRAVEPVVEYLPHISGDISSIRVESNLPSSVTGLICFIEEYCNTKVAGIGVGPQRDQFVSLK